MDMSGGAGIEALAKSGDPHSHKINVKAPLSKYRDCNFSFSGTMSAFKGFVQRLEREHGECCRIRH